MTNKALFWSFFAAFCASCASLRLTRTVFSRLLNKAISMALWTKAITCDKAGFKSRFCQEHQAGKNIISVNPVILSNFSSCLCVFVAKNLFNLRNLRLINDLRVCKLLYNCREDSTIVESSLQINLFMQNKANFRKSQMNVNKVLTRDYVKRTLGESGKNEPKTNPNEPNQSQLKPIKCQNKPNQSQFLSAISVAGQSQKHLFLWLLLGVRFVKSGQYGIYVVNP